MYNKTWNLYRTTPFFHHDSSQYSNYEQELLSFIAANAVNFTSSALNPQTGSGLATTTFVNSNRAFPVQIDNAGHNIIETLDHPGDIKSVTFERLILEEPPTAGENPAEKDQDQQRPDGRKDSLLITLTIRPKGKKEALGGFTPNTAPRTRDGGLRDTFHPDIIYVFVYTLEPYNVLYQHNRQSKRPVVLLCLDVGPDAG